MMLENDKSTYLDALDKQKHEHFGILLLYNFQSKSPSIDSRLIHWTKWDRTTLMHFGNAQIKIIINFGTAKLDNVVKGQNR